MIVISFSTWIKHFSFSFLYCPLNSLRGYLLCSHEVTSTWIKHFSFWSYFDMCTCSYLDLKKAYFFRVPVVYCPLNSFFSYFDMVTVSYAFHRDQSTFLWGRVPFKTKLGFFFWQGQKITNLTITYSVVTFLLLKTTFDFCRVLEYAI